MSIREAKGSPKYIGASEKRKFTLDTANWGGYASGAANYLYDQYGNNKSTTLLSGSVSESGGVITSKFVGPGLIAGNEYYLIWEWVYSDQTFWSWCKLIVEKY